VRKLRRSYNGPCCRIRRSSDSAEKDILFRNGWLDTIEADAFVGAGTGYLVTWYDQSGRGKDLTQGTAAAQPQYINSISGAGNKPGFLFASASSQYVTRTQDVVQTGAVPLTMFAVAVRPATEATTRIIGIGTNSAGQTPGVGTASANARVQVGYNTGTVNSANNSWPVSTGKAIAARFDNVNNYALIDGVSASVAATSLNVGSTECSVGRQPGGSYWDGHVLEALVYGNATVDWINLQAEQKSTFGV
jgi:hypothetical protein